MASQPVTPEAIIERRKSYSYGCPECGNQPVRKSAKGPPPVFCSPECKKAMEARKLADGRAISALAKAWRIARNNRADASLAAECLTAMSAIIDLQNERDRKNGITTAMTLGYAVTLLGTPMTYRDRSDNARSAQPVVA